MSQPQSNSFVHAPQHLDTLINTTTDAIWSLDRQYRFIYANQTVVDLSHALNIHIKPGDSFFIEGFEHIIKSHWKTNLDKVLEGELVSFVEEANFGDISFVAQIKLFPIYEQGKIMGVGCFSRDITEAFKSQKKIGDQQEQLREIAALASHDIRGPVASILGLASIFNTNNPHDPINAEVLNCVKQLAEALDSTIYKIVTASYKGQ